MSMGLIESDGFGSPSDNMGMFCDEILLMNAIPSVAIAALVIGFTKPRSRASTADLVEVQERYIYPEGLQSAILYCPILGIC